MSASLPTIRRWGPGSFIARTSRPTVFGDDWTNTAILTYRASCAIKPPDNEEGAPGQGTISRAERPSYGGYSVMVPARQTTDKVFLARM